MFCSQLTMIDSFKGVNLYAQYSPTLELKLEEYLSCVTVDHVLWAYTLKLNRGTATVLDVLLPL